MAPYITPSVAAAKMAKYAGVTIPSTAGSPSDMDNLITEATSLVNEYLGYSWEVSNFTQNIMIDRSGFGWLTGFDPAAKPIISITNVTVPAGAQYTGDITVNKDNIEWNPGGQFYLGHLPVKGTPEWLNPVSIIREYPSQVKVEGTAGRADTQPIILETVMVRLLVLLTLMQDDPDVLISSKIDIKDMGLETENTYIRDAIPIILRPLGRYRL